MKNPSGFRFSGICIVFSTIYAYIVSYSGFWIPGISILFWFYLIHDICDLYFVIPRISIYAGYILSAASVV